jgi:polar amino acid transport system substrate-binding protein
MARLSTRDDWGGGFMVPYRYALLLALSLLGVAADACGPYRIAYRMQPGVYERLPDGTPRGSDHEVMQELMRRTGCRFEERVLSSALAWRSLEQGEIDLIPTTLQTPEREPLADIVAVIAGRMVLLLRAEQAQRTPTLALLAADAGARVLKLRGAAYPPVIQQWLEGFSGRVSEAGDLPAALRAFEAGRADAMPIYPLLLRSENLPGLDRYVVWDLWPGSAIPGGLAMSRKTVSAADRQRLRGALHAMVRDGTLLRIVEKYFEPALVRDYLLLKPPALKP